MFLSLQITMEGNLQTFYHSLVDLATNHELFGMNLHGLYVLPYFNYVSSYHFSYKLIAFFMLSITPQILRNTPQHLYHFICLRRIIFGTISFYDLQINQMI